MSSPPHDILVAITQLTGEVASLRASLDGLQQRLHELVDENRALHERLARSESARLDLFAQTEHLVELLAVARREVRALQQKAASGAT